jgi:kynureninase
MLMNFDRGACANLDSSDPLASVRERFDLPQNTIYLDGNSLGPLPKTVQKALSSVISKEWGTDLISSWNRHDWIGLPRRVGEKVAAIIGAAKGQVVATDSTSINVFKLLSAALRAQKGRSVILSTRENFPTDLYMAEGLSQLLGQGECELRVVAADQVRESLNQDVAVLMLTHVDFRSGRVFDMESLTQAAHDVGALTLWDLAHSAGAVPLALDAHGVDLAVGCGYKYLNGGPGAPAFLYVAERLQSIVQQPLAGWMGHANPFEFGHHYQPAPGIERFLCGTPPVLAMRALDTAMDVWADIDMQQVRRKSVELCELFIRLVEHSTALRELRLASPRDSAVRGSQVSFAHPEGYAIMQALIDAGVIGDFRDPDLLRFGFTPLYTRFVDVWDAVSILERIVADGVFKESRFRQRLRVT